MKRLAAVMAVSLCFMTAACSKNSSNSSTKTLTVFAASSLTKAFTQMGTDFQNANSGTKVVFNFASSSDLAPQIESQHGADVFASASSKWMDDVSSKTGVTGRVNFATNSLVIIVPASNPANITSIKDLGKPGVKLILGEAGVPVGDYAMEALTNAGVADQATKNVVSYEPDDKSVVAKITSGEGDAAIVYVSDTNGMDATQAKAITIPASYNVVATYPIAVINGASQAQLGQSWIDYVMSSAGQATLQSFGFGPAPPA
jgi:molybdate transport system substrate-binding protein